MKLKVGLLCDESLDIRQSCGLFQDNDKYQIECLLVQLGTSKKLTTSSLIAFIRRRGFVAFTRYLFFSLVQTGEAVIAKLLRLNVGESRDRLECARAVLRDCPKTYITAIKSPSGLVYRYSDADCDEVKQLNLDVIIRCGSGILRGEILQAARYGIWSFHHGDNRWNRGGPPGFWEVYFRRPSTGVILQCLDDTLDGGRVLLRGNFPTQVTSYLNRENVIDRSSFFLNNALEYLYEHRVLPHDENVIVYTESLYRYPSILTQCLYLIKTFGLLLAFLYRKARRIEYTWHLYFYKQRWINIDLSKPDHVLLGNNGFKADPFLIEIGGKHFCFYEFFPFDSRKGVINAAIVGDSLEEVGTVLEEDFHLSFPFCFAVDGDIYLLPEAHESNRLTLYRVHIDRSNKIQVVKHQTLLDGVSCVDPILFRRGERWWLLVNKDSSGCGDFCSELHAYSSAELVSDRWEAHPKNPLIIDSGVARNAGLLVEGDDFYRVYQKQGFNMYGKSFGAAKVVELNFEEYKEATVFEVEKPVKGLGGMHTFNSDSGFVVSDGAQRVRIKRT